MAMRQLLTWRTTTPLPFRVRCLRICVWLVVISAVTVVLSTTTWWVRLLHLGTVGAGLLTGALWLSRVRWLPYLLLGLVVALVAWAVFAGRPPDTGKLRQVYLARLVSFNGAHYIWGGETHIGIDCSGLARVALLEAMVQRGLAEMNPRLLGPQLWRFWWNDLAARDMLNGTYGYTHPVRQVDQLAGYAGAELQPGDLAVAHNGLHVLIYLGNKRWIEALPEDHGITINTAIADSPRHYFHTPVMLVRWQMLETPAHR